MQLSISTKGDHARAVSYLLAKNPNNVHERRLKGHAIRFVYHRMNDEELHATIFVTPDSLALVQSNQVMDITHYINDREFAVSSIFLSLIRSSLATALNGKPKIEYAHCAVTPYPFTFHIGPITSSLSNEAIVALWTPLSYTVEIEAISTDQRARFLTLHVTATLQQALRQLFVLIPVIDDYKHYYIDEQERERLESYGVGWLDVHPARDFIYKKTLRFQHLLGTERKTAPSLNTERYEAIAAAVEKLRPRTVVDMGAGEGRLTEQLAHFQLEKLYAVDPSNRALQKMQTRLAHIDMQTTPIIKWGSLYYVDKTFINVDIFILCEVIEHINEERLPAIITLLKHYRPKHIIVTTPNAEYNHVYGLAAMRHADHRFEWTRAQFRDWCMRLDDYSFELFPIGPADATYGSPTQMAVFTRRTH